MYCAIGLLAMLMPAMKAPISADNPSHTESSASPKHHPIDNKKMYS